MVVTLEGDVAGMLGMLLGPGEVGGDTVVLRIGFVKVGKPVEKVEVLVVVRLGNGGHV